MTARPAKTARPTKKMTAEVAEVTLGQRNRDPASPAWRLAHGAGPSAANSTIIEAKLAELLQERCEFGMGGMI